MSHTHTHTGPPPLPEGEELHSSDTKPSAGLFSHLPSPDLGSIQTSSEDVEEISDDPHTLTAPSASEAGVKDHSIQIQVVDEDDDEEELNEETDVLIRTNKRGELYMCCP